MELADLQITIDGELNVAHIESMTDAGEDFVDAFVPKGEMHVVDSGRIIISYDDVDALYVAAKESSLMWEVVGR